VVRVGIARRGPGQLDGVVHQQERAAWIFEERIEFDPAVGAAGAASRDGGADHHGTAKLLGARRNSQRVQPLYVMNGQLTSRAGTVVTPVFALRKLTCHSGED
jgi:hypothetical protein